MVFENLTLFEVKLEDAQFGTRRTNDADTMDDDTETETIRSRRSMSILLGALLIVGAAVYVWRSTRSEIELEDDRQDSEAELTTSR